MSSWCQIWRQMSCPPPCRKVWLSLGIAVGSEVSRTLIGRLCYRIQMCLKISRGCSLRRAHNATWPSAEALPSILRRVFIISNTGLCKSLFLDTFSCLLFLSCTTAPKLKHDFSPSLWRHRAVSQSVEPSRALFAYFSGSILAVLPHLALSVLSRLMSFGMRNRCVCEMWGSLLYPSQPPCASPSPVSGFYDKANAGRWAVETQAASKVSKYKSGESKFTPIEVSVIKT